ncbi:MAG TPA: 2-dehydropantoate 2-reductase [Kofleriaceae bacterium]|nr:2-dehydropantoate 2-reductase [Kofleriaceae bacterium]
MKVHIIGAGGVGCYFGGLLARAGHDVGYVARGRQLEALSASPLEVQGVTVGNFEVKVRAAARADDLGPADVVLFCVKTYDTDEALAHLPPLVGPATMVLGLQNGLDSTSKLIKVAGREKVLGAVVYINAEVIAPGVVSHKAGPQRIVFGELGGAPTERARRLHQALADSGADAQLHEHIQVAIWTKFAIICGYSGALALARSKMGPFQSDPDMKQLLRGAIHEAVMVGRAMGIDLPADLTDRHMAALEKFEPHAQSSMEVDLAAGRRLEVSALNGTVLRLGRETGVATPYNAAIYAGLKPFEGGRRP